LEQSWNCVPMKVGEALPLVRGHYPGDCSADVGL
jgi:hypothetical protein